MYAVLGEHDVTRDEGVEKSCRINKTVQHPQYNGQTKHDIMLGGIKCNVCTYLQSLNISVPMRLKIITDLFASFSSFLAR
jgi:hypothetical protein